jgi:diguanylate cyclase (GGDEF)-like protein
MLGDHDALTGCLTRAAFQTAIQTFPLPYVLAILDLNLLKSVNTLKGHSGGDAHIRTVAYAIRAALPPGGLLCRWGGDEFVILTPGEDRDAWQQVLDEVNAHLPQPLPDISAFTVGMAVREHGTPYDRAFALADEQLELRKEHLRQGTSAGREADSLVTFSQELEALRDPGDLIEHALDRLLNLLDFDQATYTNIEGTEIFNSHHTFRAGAPIPQPELYGRLPLASTGLIRIAHHTRTTEWSTDYPSTPNCMQNVVDQGIGKIIPAFDNATSAAGVQNLADTAKAGAQAFANDPAKYVSDYGTTGTAKLGLTGGDIAKVELTFTEKLSSATGFSSAVSNSSGLGPNASFSDLGD